MTETIRVLIADDHEAVRSGVASILGTSSRITVVGEAANGAEALAECHALRPDVALLDLRMPGRDGIWAAERITAETPTQVLVLTTFDTAALVSDALAAGAHGYLLKSTSGAELIRAVEHVAEDRYVIDPAIAGTLVARFTGAVGGATGGSTGAPGAPALGSGVEFTARELDVLGLVAQGLSNQQIADRLHIGITTAKTHVGALYAKTGATSRVQLAAFARTA